MWILFCVLIVFVIVAFVIWLSCITLFGLFIVVLYAGFLLSLSGCVGFSLGLFGLMCFEFMMDCMFVGFVITWLICFVWNSVVLIYLFYVVVLSVFCSGFWVCGYCVCILGGLFVSLVLMRLCCLEFIECLFYCLLGWLFGGCGCLVCFVIISIFGVWWLCWFVGWLDCFNVLVWFSICYWD